MGQSSAIISVVPSDSSPTTAITPRPAASPYVSDVKLSASFLRSVLLWACNDETRSGICAVHFNGRDVVATDGHRLVKATVIPTERRRATEAAWGIEGGQRRYTIPRRELEMACKAAGKGGTVEIRLSTSSLSGHSKGVDDDKARGRVHGVLVACAAQKRNRYAPTAEVSIPWRDSDLPFPPYGQVIPNHDSLMTADPKAKQGAKREGEAMDTDDFLRSRDLCGHGINPRYLGDMADVIESFGGNVPAVLVAAHNPLDPVCYESIVTLDNGERALLTFVIMPMRVGDAR